MIFGKSKSKITQEEVKKALSTVMDPDLNQDIVSLNMISDIKVEGSKVYFKLTLTTPACPLKEKIENDCREAVKAIPGVEEIEMVSGATVAGRGKVSDKEPVAGIKHIIAVTSGKGGVGKTTVTINLAVALSKLGAKVGILDSDITGPNCPLMLGVDSHQPAAKDNRIQPAENYGIKCMSMAFFVAKDTPLIWRGPMLDKAIRQFLRDVEWGELDYLLVDMPPGTGDAQLSMVQSTDMSGGVIVTTPQEVALLDGQRGLVMFRQMNVPVLGFVENMSYFQPEGTSERYEIFGHGGGRKMADEYGVPFLGEVPIDIRIREGGDTGQPLVACHPDSPAAKAFIDIAKQVAAQVSIHSLQPVG
ncbi:MAG: Mrp/NBP35 family ATP-binding protein [Candidatus Obscuribacterales bacterium]|nr:Mrp/NBP35 family ATP-binding protein [Candidatus Obscuribacterales bacterium]